MKVWKAYMWIMLIILTNCNDDCSTGNPSGNLKSVSGRYLEVFDVFSDGSLLADELDISIAHEFQSIGILLSFEVEVMGQQPASCDSTFAIIQDTVAQILITSDTDYDDNHAAGESLNDLFRMTTYNAIPQDFNLIAQSRERIREDLFCFVQTLAIQIEPCECQHGIRILRIQLENETVLLYGVFKRPRLRIDAAQLMINPRIQRINVNRSAILLNRFVRFILEFVHEP